MKDASTPLIFAATIGRRPSMVTGKSASLSTLQAASAAPAPSRAAITTAPRKQTLIPRYPIVPLWNFHRRTRAASRFGSRQWVNGRAICAGARHEARYHRAKASAGAGVARTVWKQAALYGIFLAAAALALQWLDYQRLVRAHPGDFYVFLVALAFLALGLFIGARVIAPPKPVPFDGNPRALATLGISPRELKVLEEIAAGHSNKEIARRLN